MNHKTRRNPVTGLLLCAVLCSLLLAGCVVRNTIDASGGFYSGTSSD